ncbi:uncharacterized protein IL334_005894 [Kwoniella shivajii]|uniref:ACB domain-containing protein n=1 Tax=Kwoniella shivajii TaxID=564305 RepID=A0ABZ1D5N9_9TREE|nr:hypothetical protein IL334_005894 [Kwoniella shivajii]
MSSTDNQKQREFDIASAWLSSAPSAASLSNDVKLELYGLFKFISTSAGPPGGRPSIFSPTPRAKYDAWVAQLSKYASAGENGINAARDRYVVIAKEIGWSGDNDDDEEVDLENLDTEPSAIRKDKGKSQQDNPIGGVKVSVMSEEGEQGDTNSPLHDAVIANRLEEVRALIKKGYIINDKDEFGYTPLHLAADRGHAEMTSLLLLLGADRDVKDEDDLTPITLAEISGRDDVVAILALR